MSATRSPDYLASIVRELCKLAKETEWVEFKRNNDNPKEIGEYLSALSNAATLADKAFAYLVWGVDDSTHAIVGTTVTPMSDKIGNEELESWLLRQLSPKLNFRFHEVTVEGHRVVLLEIERARPTANAVRGDRVLPSRQLQEEAEGLPRESAGAVACLRPYAV